MTKRATPGEPGREVAVGASHGGQVLFVASEPKGRKFFFFRRREK